MYALKKLIRLAILTVSFVSITFSTDYNPPYPRLGFHSFYNIIPERLGKHDLTALSMLKIDAFTSAKAINPGIINLAALDWLDAEFPGRSTNGWLPEEWKLRRPDGTPIEYCNSIMPNMSDLCPPCTSVSASDPMYNKKFIEYYPEYLVKEAYNNFQGECSVIDGVFGQTFVQYTDSELRTSAGVDYNCNQIKDQEEFSAAWVDSIWKSSWINLIAGFRMHMPADKVVVGNTWRISRWFTNKFDIKPFN